MDHKVKKFDIDYFKLGKYRNNILWDICKGEIRRGSKLLEYSRLEINDSGRKGGLIE